MDSSRRFCSGEMSDMRVGCPVFRARECLGLYGLFLQQLKNLAFVHYFSWNPYKAIDLDLWNP